MYIEGEDTFWQAGISGNPLIMVACAVCDGAVPIFRNKPLAVVGGMLFNRIPIEELT